MGAQWYDANISLPGCDKNMPGTIIAMARFNRPSLMIYGGACCRGGRRRAGAHAACSRGAWGSAGRARRASRAAHCAMQPARSPARTCAAAAALQYRPRPDAL